MTLKISTLALVAVAIMAQAGQAAFFFEGLQPFSKSFCDGADAKNEAWIRPPADTWDKSSPDESSLNGRPAWDAECKAGKYGPKAPTTATKITKPTKHWSSSQQKGSLDEPVPQK